MLINRLNKILPCTYQIKSYYKRNRFIPLVLIFLIIVIGLFNISCSEECNEECTLEVEDIKIPKSVVDKFYTDEPLVTYLIENDDKTFCEQIKNKLNKDIPNMYGLDIELNTMSLDNSSDTIDKLKSESGMDIKNFPILIIGKFIMCGSDNINKDFINSLSETAQTPPAFRKDWIEDCEKDCELEVVDVSKNTKDKKSYNEPVKIYYFFELGCSYCRKLEDKLKNDFTKTTGVKLDLVLMDIEKEIGLIQALRKKTNKKIEGSPILVVGSYIMSGKHDINDHYNDYIMNTSEIEPKSRVDLIDGLESEEVSLPGFILVITMGLVDGINPCAFATIIFLISYLAYSKKTKRETLIIGIIYTVAVFLTYFFAGFVFLGALSTFVTSTSYKIVSVIIKIISIALVGVLAIVTLLDFIKALRGDVGDMTLTLSDKMKRRIHKIIRNRLKFRGIIISSIVIGIVVSFFELACTGQVYLPTILYIVNNESTGLTTKYIGYIQLLVYNLAFIVPLVIIFLVSYFGVSSKSMQNALQKHTATIKFILFLLFFGLTIYMVLAYFVLVP